MKEDVLPEANQIPRMACYVPASGTFVKIFVYSAWGYALVTCLIKRVTGEPFRKCVEKYTFQPLGMAATTINMLETQNVVVEHWIWHRRRGA